MRFPPGHAKPPGLSTFIQKIRDKFESLSPRARQGITLCILAGFIALAAVLLWMAFREDSAIEELVISGGAPGGAYQRIAETLAAEIRIELPDTEVRVIPSQGSLENVNHVTKGEAQLGIVQNDVDGPANIRVLSPLHEEVLHVFVLKGSGIESLPDLRGKRIAVGPEGGGTAKLIRNLFDQYGLTEADVEMIYGPSKDAIAALNEEEVDVCAMVTALGSELCCEILSNGKAQLMGIAEPGMNGSIVDGFRLHYPFIHPAIIPRGSYATESVTMMAPPDPLGTIGVRSLLICREDLPDSETRKITDAVIHARPKLIEMGFPELADSQLSFQNAYRYPFHPSVVSHLSRNPTFLEQYAESMGFVLSAVFALGGVLASARKWISQVKKDRIDEFYLQLDEIQTRLVRKKLTSEELHDILQTLLKSRHRAVRALVNENVVADESFLIFQSLLTDSIREVERQLRVAEENG